MRTDAAEIDELRALSGIDRLETHYRTLARQRPIAVPDRCPHTHKVQPRAACSQCLIADGARVQITTAPPNGYLSVSWVRAPGGGIATGAWDTPSERTVGALRRRERMTSEIPTGWVDARGAASILGVRELSSEMRQRIPSERMTIGGRPRVIFREADVRADAERRGTR